MSRHRWNTVQERMMAASMIQYSSLIINKMIVNDCSSMSSNSSISTNDSSASDATETSSDSSSSLSWSGDNEEDDDNLDNSSIESQDLLQLQIITRIHNQAAAYTQRIFEPIVQEIQWGRRLLVDDLSESEAILEFRFRKQHLQAIANKLWPKLSGFIEGTQQSIKVSNGYRAPYETGLLAVLFQLARPHRLWPDMEKFFGMRKSHLSSLISTMVDALYNVSLPYLSNAAIHQQRIPYYADRVSNKCGNLVTNVWGFIDGTLQKICRPVLLQKHMYSGHKRVHGIKFQSVVTPDGLIALLFGPINGNRHDSYMLRESGLLPQLHQLMPLNGVFYSLYGDPAYPQSAYLFGGYRNAGNGTPQAAFNTAMSAIREPVEWSFKEIIAQFSFLDFKTSLRIFKFPVAKYYVIAAFLTNIRSFYYGNQTATYFNAQTYTLDEYLSITNNNA